MLPLLQPKRSWGFQVGQIDHQQSQKRRSNHQPENVTIPPRGHHGRKESTLKTIDPLAIFSAQKGRLDNLASQNSLNWRIPKKVQPDGFDKPQRILISKS